MSDKPVPPPPGMAVPPFTPLPSGLGVLPSPPPRLPPPLGPPVPPSGIPPPPLASMPPLPRGVPPSPGLPSSPLPRVLVSAPPFTAVPTLELSALEAPPMPTAVVQPASRQMDAVVVDSVRRTATTASIYLFVGEIGSYRAGQFLSIDPHQFPEIKHWVDFLEEHKGKVELPRAYSMQSAPGEKCLSICVEVEGFDPKQRKYPPLLSPFLAMGALKGRELVVSGFTGVYVIPDDIEQHTDEVLHVVAGSGVVPSYSILKDELKNKKNQRVKHVMIAVNRTVADIVLHEQLDALARAYPERFQLVHLVTDDAGELPQGYLHGRPSAELLARCLRDPSTARVYASGPAITRWQRQAAREHGVDPAPRFMESVMQLVEELGVPRAHVTREEWG